MNIKDKSLEELKILAYDTMSDIGRLQANLEVLHRLIKEKTNERRDASSSEPSESKKAGGGERDDKATITEFTK